MQKGANMNTNSRNVTYSTIGDYQLPNLTLNQPRKPLGKYGRLRRTYLKEHRPVLYNTMLGCAWHLVYRALLWRELCHRASFE